MRKVKKILLTGHKGFIGQNMVRFFSQRGVEVYGLEKEDPFPSIKKFQEVDAVIHLGATSSTTETDLAAIINNNLLFSQKVYAYCSAANIPFQYASSASVYGNSHSTHEYDFYRPLNQYGTSKYAFDLWINSIGGQYQGFRYFNVYGPHEEHKGNQASPVSKFTWQAQKDGEIKLFKKSEFYIRDFVSVADVCEAHWQFLQKPEINGIFNVGTGNPVSFQFVAETIANKFSADIKYIDMPEELKNSYQEWTCADLSLFETICPSFCWTKLEDYVKVHS